MEETERRRTIQLAYNKEHGITPRTVTKSIEEIKEGTRIADHKQEEAPITYYTGVEQLGMVADPVLQYLDPQKKRDLIKQLGKEMEAASESLEFEKAAEIRDTIAQLEMGLDGWGEG